jgi:hypothetical protein
MNDKMIFSTMLLSYRYLYMRTRGHEASPSWAKPNRIPPEPTRRTQYISTGSFGSALPFGIQTYPRIVQLFPPKELLGNAFFLSLPVLFRLSVSLPFPITNSIPIAVARALAGFSEKHSKTTKTKGFFLNEMQPGGALAPASLRTFLPWDRKNHNRYNNMHPPPVCGGEE